MFIIQNKEERAFLAKHFDEFERQRHNELAIFVSMQHEILLLEYLLYGYDMATEWIQCVQKGRNTDERNKGTQCLRITKDKNKIFHNHVYLIRCVGRASGDKTLEHM